MFYSQGKMCYFHFADEDMEAERQCTSGGNAHR